MTTISTLRHYCYLALACWILLPTVAVAQSASPGPLSFGNEGLSLELGATAQVRAMYARDDLAAASRLGFGIRRLRLRLRAAMGSRLAFFVQGEGANADFKVLDLALEYRLSPSVKVRAGRIISARPAAFGSHTGIDAVDRPVSLGEWAKRTIGVDGHDFGLEVQVDGAQGYVRTFLHNGDGDWNRARGNFREEVGMGDVTRGINRTGLAATLEAAYRPAAVRGLEVGGFAGVNTAHNPNTGYEEVGRAYTTYGVHAYWGATPGSQAVRLKADLLAIQYETLAAAIIEAPADYQQRMQGVSLLAAGRVFRAGEVFARYERFDPNAFVTGDGYTFTTVGASFSPSAMRGQPYHRERITLAWTARFDPSAEIPSYGLVLQAQIAF